MLHLVIDMHDPMNIQIRKLIPHTYNESICQWRSCRSMAIKKIIILSPLKCLQDYFSEQCSKPRLWQDDSMCCINTIRIILLHMLSWPVTTSPLFLVLVRSLWQLLWGNFIGYRCLNIASMRDIAKLVSLMQHVNLWVKGH